MPVEEVTLTARFKVDLADVDESAISEIYRHLGDIPPIRGV